MYEWGQPHCNSSSSIHFFARQHNKVPSLSYPSICNLSLRSQLQTKRSFQAKPKR